jgi:hypothetical protein
MVPAKDTLKLFANRIWLITLLCSLLPLFAIANKQTFSRLYLGWVVYGVLSSILLLIFRKKSLSFFSNLCVFVRMDKRLIFLITFLVGVFQSHIFLGIAFGGIGGWDFRDSKPEITSSLNFDSPTFFTKQGNCLLTYSKCNALKNSLNWEVIRKVPDACWKGTSLIIGFAVQSQLQSNNSDPKSKVLALQWIPISYGSTGMVFPTSIEKSPEITFRAVQFHSWSKVTLKLNDTLKLNKWKYPSHTPYNFGDLISFGRNPPKFIEEWEMEICKNRKIAGVKSINFKASTSEISLF